MVTIKYCSYTDQLTAEGWRWVSVGTSVIQWHSLPSVPHRIHACDLLFLTRCWQYLRTDKPSISQEVPSHCSPSPTWKSTGFSGLFLACPTFLEEPKPCSGIKPIPSRHRKVLGNSKTFYAISQLLESCGAWLQHKPPIWMSYRHENLLIAIKRLLHIHASSRAKDTFPFIS